MWILKHPNAWTLAQVSESVTPPGEGWEEMTSAEFAAWKQGQIDSGWRPPLTESVPLPDAEMYQVRQWLIRKAREENRPDVHPDRIPDTIRALITDPVEQELALDRWATVTRVPADNALVLAVAASLGLTIAEAWPEILAVQ